MLTSFCFATMGTLFASYPTESPGDIMSMLNVVRMPLIFISGVFIPLNQLPPAAQIIPLLSPLMYGNDLARATFATNTHFSPFVYIAVLAVFIPVSQFVANGLYRLFNDKRRRRGPLGRNDRCRKNNNSIELSTKTGKVSPKVLQASRKFNRSSTVY